MTVDLAQLGKDLAAAYYMAMLRPDPTLDDDPDQKALVRYQTAGADLLDALRSEPVLTHCKSGTRQAHPDRHSAALATVLGRTLVSVRIDRGRKTAGLRRSPVALFHIPLLRRLGLRSLTTFCWECEGSHDLSFRWLERARNNEVSAPSQDLDEFKTSPDSYSAVDQYGLPFAFWIGALPLRTDQGQPIISTSYLFASSYFHHFGPDPPHDRHLDRLTLQRHPEELMPGADRIRRPHPYPELLKSQTRILNQTRAGKP